jgi:hypothetical protein
VNAKAIWREAWYLQQVQSGFARIDLCLIGLTRSDISEGILEATGDHRNMEL